MKIEWGYNSVLNNISEWLTHPRFTIPSICFHTLTHLYVVSKLRTGEGILLCPNMPLSCKVTILPLHTQISMCLTWECVVLLYQDPLPWLPLLPRWPLPSSSPRPALLLLWWWRWWWWWCPRRPERGDPTGEVWVSDVTDDLFKQFDVKWVREGRSESVLLLLPKPGWTQNIINWLTS